MEYHDCDVCNNRIAATLHTTVLSVLELNRTEGTNDTIEMCDRCAHPFNADDIACLAHEAVIAYLRKEAGVK